MTCREQIAAAINEPNAGRRIAAILERRRRELSSIPVKERTSADKVEYTAVRRAISARRVAA